MPARSSVLPALFVLSLLVSPALAESINIPNGSFESPYLEVVAPYATSDISDWQKAPAPEGYPADQWANAAGIFVNVPWAPVDNIDGRQLGFMFSNPGYELYQDLDATFSVDRSYRLTVGIVGGGYGMQLGCPMEIRLYYRDGDGTRVTIAAEQVANTNTTGSLTHLTDYALDLPVVAAGDAWAGKNIGVQLIQTATPEMAGGYWDFDNVRLTATAAPEPGAIVLLAVGLGGLAARRWRAWKR
jgi:hypothetical protein